jgi:hypothetical protein
MEALAAAIVAGLGGVLGYYVRPKLEARERERERVLAAQRKLYDDLLDPIIRALAGVGDAKVLDEALADLRKPAYKKTVFSFSMTGDDRVVSAFNRMMQCLYTTPSGPGDQAMLFFGDLLLEIRRSVGVPRTRLTARDMLAGLFKPSGQR